MRDRQALAVQAGRIARSVDWTAYQSLQQPPRGLSWPDLESAVWLDTGERTTCREAFYAFRMLALRLPPLTALAPALWLPGMGRVGDVGLRMGGEKPLPAFELSRSERGTARMTTGGRDVSIVVPTYNERDNVEALCRGLKEALEPAWNYEIIFVDDNSPDGTYDVVLRLGEEDPRVRLIRRPGKLGTGQRGVGWVRAGRR